MRFTNDTSMDVRIRVFNQTDSAALIARWSQTVGPGETAEYRPRHGDSRQYRASVSAAEGDGNVRWLDDLRDDGQAVDIVESAGRLIVTAILAQENDVANWMGNLGSSFGRRDLRQVLIPGTHDSGSFSADMTPAVRTQDEAFAFQLRNGIRYFDLRISDSTASPALGFKRDTFYLCHNCVSARDLEFEPQLRAVAEFTESHPSEIVLLDFHHVLDGIYPYPVGGAPPMSQHARNELLAMVKRHLADRMVPAGASTTISDLWSAGTNVVVLLDGDDPLIWPQDQIKVLWDVYSSSTDIDASVAKKIASLKTYLERELPNVDSDKVFNNAAAGIWNTAIRLSANEVNRNLVDWLEHWHAQPELRDKLNVVSVDYFQYSDVVRTTIRLNGRYARGHDAGSARIHDS